MRKPRRIITSIFLALLIAIGSSTSGAASSLPALRDQKKELDADIKRAKDVKNEISAEKNELLAELLQLDIELDEAADEYYLISDELDRTREELEQTKIDLADAEARYDTQYAAMKDRIRFMYESGDIGYLEILFESQDFADFLNRVEYVNRIVGYDQSLVARLLETEQQIAANLEAIRVKEIEVSALTVQCETRMHSLEDAMEVKDSRVQELTEDERNALQILSDFEAANAKVKKQIEDIEAENARKAAAAAAAAKANTSSFNGKFTWPVQGHSRVSSGYGWRTSPISGKREYHTGIDIPAPTGTDISAAEAGRVITSGWMNGYGYTVVIDHGGGVTTLYGHASKLLVSVGQEVSRGQTIARVGSTGWSTGPHLHFQVMERGGHVTPKGYLNY